MDRGTRIARARGRAHDKLRRIFNRVQCLIILAGDQNNWGDPIAKYDSGWYLNPKEYTDVSSGKRFKYLLIDDPDGCRLSILKAMTAVQYGDSIFTFHGKDSFVSGVPTYEFKIVHVGVRI